MPMDASVIESLIRAGIPDARVVITDLAGDGDHYAAKVYSPSFAGKTRLQQHQMVYLTLGDKMGGELHALSVQTSSDPNFLA
jgi:stress-induced morphogen